MIFDILVKSVTLEMLNLLILTNKVKVLQKRLPSPKFKGFPCTPSPHPSNSQNPLTLPGIFRRSPIEK